jgi:hypothetical protein
VREGIFATKGIACQQCPENCLSEDDGTDTVRSEAQHGSGCLKEQPNTWPTLGLQQIISEGHQTEIGADSRPAPACGIYGPPPEEPYRTLLT